MLVSDGVSVSKLFAREIHQSVTLRPLQAASSSVLASRELMSARKF